MRQLAVESVTRVVTVRGIEDIMFDRYPGDNKTELRPEQKFYYASDGKTLVLPATNILSFLSAENTMSAPKRLLDSRVYKKVTQACKSFVRITPRFIPFLRDGKSIQFTGFVNDLDKAAGCYVHYAVARLKDGIPNPKVRPVIQLPWELQFRLSLHLTSELSEEQLQNLFVRGGPTLGFGTWHGVYGLFEVVGWEAANE